MKRYKVFEQILQTILFIAAIFLLGGIIMIVHEIQETSQVIRCASVIKSFAQRIVKLEMAYNVDNEKIAYMGRLMQTLQNGSYNYNLKLFSEKKFQEELFHQMKGWETLRREIYEAREEGWQETNVLEVSEHYFYLCGNTISVMNEHMTELVADMRRREAALFVIILILAYINIRRYREAVGAKKKNRILQQKAYFDPVTQVRNRRYFEEFFQKMIDESDRYVFCYLDLDGLKYVNDTFGHAEGDRYLIDFLASITREIRFTDEIFRLGGDEFAIFMNGCSKERAQKILATARKRFMRNETRGYKRSFSYGIVAVQGEQYKRIEDLLHEGDAQMYEFKLSNKEQDRSVTS